MNRAPDSALPVSAPVLDAGHAGGAAWSQDGRVRQPVPAIAGDVRDSRVAWLRRPEGASWITGRH